MELGEENRNGDRLLIDMGFLFWDGENTLKLNC